MKRGKKARLQRNQQRSSQAAKHLNFHVVNMSDLRDVKSARVSGGKSSASAASSSSSYCVPCKKAFSSEAGLLHHLRDSPRHPEQVRTHNTHDVQNTFRSQTYRNGGHWQPSHTSTPHYQNIQHDSGSNISSEGQTASAAITRQNREMLQLPHNAPSHAKKRKGWKRRTPVTLLPDLGHASSEDVEEQHEADSSTEDLLISTQVQTASGTSVCSTHTAQDIDNSETESAYFTSEETSVPPPRLSKESDQVPLAKFGRLTLSENTSHGAQPPAASTIPQSPRMVLPALESAPSRSSSRASSSRHSRVSLPWDDILNSDIARDIYETSDNGGIRCLTCAKWLNNFRDFKRHYEMSQMHLQHRSNSSSLSLRDENENGPPPLVRVASPGVPTARQNMQARFDGRSTASHHSNHSDPRQQRNYPCTPCNLVYTNITALQRHKSASVREHPYYCRTCSVEHENFEALQNHYQYSNHCRAGNFSMGPENALFNYQDYQAAQLPSNYYNENMTPMTRKATKQATVMIDDAAMEDIPICPICITPLTDVVDVTATFCGHVFCAPCILEHLRTRNNCPRCRKLISSMMLIPLFF